MAVNSEKNKNVSKKPTGRDIPFSEVSENNKRLLYHLTHNHVSHKAGSIAVTGTYVNIPGTPGSLEDTLESIQTVLSVYPLITPPVNPTLSTADSILSGTSADKILTHINGVGIKHYAQDIVVEKNLDILGSPPDVESAISNIDYYLIGLPSLLPSLFLLSASTDYLFSYASPKSLAPSFRSLADILRNQWVSQTPIITARWGAASGGSREYALVAGGHNGTNDIDSTVFFNNTSWSSGPSFNNSFGKYGTSSVGTQKSFFVSGGLIGVINPGLIGGSNIYRGISWESASMQIYQRAFMASAGVINSLVQMGGTNVYTGTGQTTVDAWNGSLWLNRPYLSVGRSGSAGLGITNNACCLGGDVGFAVATAVSDKWNGSTWASATPLIVALEYMGFSGSANNALIFGGYNAGTQNVTYLYNGYSWTSVAVGIVGRDTQGNSGSAGAALSVSGKINGVTNGAVEKWYGTSPRIIIDYMAAEEVSTDYTSSDDLRYGEWWRSGSITVSAPIRAQFVSNIVYDRDDLDDLKTQFKHLVFNEGIWSNTTVLNAARFGHGSGGTQGSAFVCAGYGSYPSFLSSTEKFDGSVWSNSGNTIFTGYTCGSSGIANAALHFGGYNGSWLINAERFNGSIWASTASLNNNVSNTTGAGHQNAAIYIGGYAGGSSLAIAEVFNGLVWANISSSPSAIAAGATTGTISSAMIVGGNVTGSVVATTSLWNGSVFSTSVSAIFSLRDAVAIGPSNNAMVFGGHIDNPAHASFLTFAQEFNGSAWRTLNIMATGRGYLGKAGITQGALATGGDTASTVSSNVVEKYTTSPVFLY